MFLNSAKPTIVIAGAGFGGIRAALGLNKFFKKNPALAQKYNLYLIDQNDHHLYVPAIYEISSTIHDDAGVMKLKEVVAISLEKIFPPAEPLKFHQAEITKIDVANNKIILNDHTTLKYTQLIVGLGSVANFYNIPGLKENALTLGSLNSAIKIRSTIEKKFCEDLKTKKIIKIVIGGGGVTGVELAGELVGYIKKLNKKYQANIKPYLTIIEGQKDILPGFDAKMVSWAKKRLEQLRVNIVTGDLIEEIRFKSALTKSGGRFDFDVLVWSGGIKPNPIIETLPFEHDKRGRVAVQENFCPVFKGGNKMCSNIFIIGDNCCHLRHQTLPQTAQMAIDQGQYIAKLVLTILNIPKPGLGNKRQSLKYRPIANNYILPIGGKFALADLGTIKAKGFWVWVLKEFVFLDYLISILPFPQALAHWLKAIKLFIKND